MEKIKITKEDIISVLKKRWWIMLIEIAVIAVIIVADLVSKSELFNYLSSIKGMKIDGSFITVTYVENTGAGFGMFSDNPVILSVITSIVMAILFVALILLQKENEFLRIALTFIIGGGIGNLVDRTQLGYVRDYFQFGFWTEFPVFNIADVFVTVGGFMLIIALIIMLVQESKASKKKLAEETEANKETSVLDGKDILDVANPANEFLDNNIQENNDGKDD